MNLSTWETLPKLKKNWIRVLYPDSSLEDMVQGYVAVIRELNQGSDSAIYIFDSQRLWDAFLTSPSDWEKQSALEQGYARILYPDGNVEDVLEIYIEAIKSCDRGLRVFSQNEWDGFLRERRFINAQWMLRSTQTGEDTKMLTEMGIAWIDKDFEADRMALAKRISRHLAPGIHNL
jgi:hypothetical protein